MDQPTTPNGYIAKARELSGLADELAHPDLRECYLVVAKTWLDLSAYFEQRDRQSQCSPRRE